jgi:chitinase
VTLRTDQLGDNRFGCLWSRKRALCCTPNDDAFDTPTCDKSLCEYEGSGYSCDADPYADDYSDEYQCEAEFCDESAASSLLERGGKKRDPFTVDWQIIVNSIVYSFSLSMQMRGYPGTSKRHNPTRSTPASNNAFIMEQNNRRPTDIQIVDRTTMTAAQLSARFDTEHNPDGQYVRDFVRTSATGILPNGSETTLGAVDAQALQDNWNARVLIHRFIMMR